MLKNIKVLNISSNNLNLEIINEKFDLPELEFINLERNKLKNVFFLEKCKSLKEILLGFNQIKTTSTNFIQLKAITFLDFSNNLIENFDSLALLSFNSNLKFLNLKGNPIEKKQDFKTSFKKLFPFIKMDNLDSKVKEFLI